MIKRQERSALGERKLASKMRETGTARRSDTGVGAVGAQLKSTKDMMDKMKRDKFDSIGLTRSGPINSAIKDGIIRSNLTAHEKGVGKKPNYSA